MLTNAVITRIDQRTGASADGRELFTNGADSAIQTHLEPIANNQHFNLGALVKDCTMVCQTALTQFGSGGGGYRPQVGDRMTVGYVGDDAAVYQVVHAEDRRQGLVSHIVTFLKPLASGN